jgi:hypothetical protein
VLVDFEGAATFDRFRDVKLHLEEALKCRVDLATWKALRARWGRRSNARRSSLHDAERIAAGQRGGSARPSPQPGGAERRDARCWLAWGSCTTFRWAPGRPYQAGRAKRQETMSTDAAADVDRLTEQALALPPALRELGAYGIWESLHPVESWPLAPDQLEEVRRRVAHNERMEAVDGDEALRKGRARVRAQQSHPVPPAPKESP